MPSTRLIVVIVSAIVGLAVWLLTRGPAVEPKWQMAYGLSGFLGAYVLGSILVGFFQGMREARQQARPPSTPSSPPSPPPPLPPPPPPPPGANRP